MSSTSKTCHAVILTALEVEYDAVREHLSNLREEIHASGTIYERGTISAYGQTWDVLIVQVGAGNSSTAIEVVKAVEFGNFRPEVMLFVGVAGGLKDARLGDVVAATKVYDYESGKADEHFKTRPEVGVSSFAMINRAKAEARGKSPVWLQRIKGEIATPAPKAFVGPLASGGKVIGSTLSDAYNLLQASYGDSLAVEMEAYGFLRAISATTRIDALVVRGISDQIDNKKASDAANYQEIASRHASAFAFEVLLKLRPADTTVENVPVNANASGEQSKVVVTPTVKAPKSATDPIEIFYSFVASDATMVEELRKHLVMQRRSNQIKEWYDEKISGGVDLSVQVEHINSADIILLFVSPDYMASDKYYTNELMVAVERRAKENTWVIPIILRATDSWKDTPLGAIQHLPPGERTIADLSGAGRDQAFVNMAREIKDRVFALRPGLAKKQV